MVPSTSSISSIRERSLFFSFGFQLHNYVMLQKRPFRVVLFSFHVSKVLLLIVLNMQ
ncbi:hypothetical protein ACE6H2_000465 [Prunus campanulata]